MGSNAMRADFFLGMFDCPPLDSSEWRFHPHLIINLMVPDLRILLNKSQTDSQKI